MQAPPSSISSPPLLHPPCTFRSSPALKKPGLHQRRSSGRRVSVSSKRDGHHGRDFDGGLVDEGMIVLRERIHEMKTAEGDLEPPSDWMEWEKGWYNERYGSDVCQLVGMIQAVLMRTRPGVALGMVTLVVLSLPVSTAMIVLHLTEMARRFLE